MIQPEKKLGDGFRLRELAACSGTRKSYPPGGLPGRLPHRHRYAAGGLEASFRFQPMWCLRDPCPPGKVLSIGCAAGTDASVTDVSRRRRLGEPDTRGKPKPTGRSDLMLCVPNDRHVSDIVLVLLASRARLRNTRQGLSVLRITRKKALEQFRAERGFSRHGICQTADFGERLGSYCSGRVESEERPRRDSKVGGRAARQADTTQGAKCCAEGCDRSSSAEKVAVLHPVF